MKPAAGRYLDSGAASAAWNMAVDEVLLEGCRRRLAAGEEAVSIPVVFRVYAWAPPAISLGRGQSARRDIRIDRLGDEGIDLCRRLTGGRAVLHDRELTYSVTGPAALLGDEIEETYRRVSLGLAAGLGRLGAVADLSPPSGRAYASQASCFATSSVWELAVDGRKVAGSAQCREGGAVLQHGSILFASPESRLAGLLRSRGGPDAAPSPEADHAVGLCEILGREVTFEETAAALKAGLEEALDMPLVEEDLDSGEVAWAREVSETRYQSDSWTLGR